MLTQVPGCALVGRVVALGFVVGLSGASVLGCGGAAGVDVNLQRDLGPFIVPGPQASSIVDMAQPPTQSDGGIVSDLAVSSPADFAGPGGSCGSIDTNGECDGNTLKYCNASNMLVTKDCTASSKVCSVSSSGYANCTT
jgi:hypothetical protein